MTNALQAHGRETLKKLIAVNGASDASTTVTLDFVPDQGRKGTGTLNISAVINAEQAVKGAVDAVVEPYEASVAATASITGRYAVEDRDDDDLVVSFDPTSMDVNIDPSGVTFSENAITGMQQPTLDSLSRATSQHWRTALTPAIREVFNRYRRIEDIKVHQRQHNVVRSSRPRLHLQARWRSRLNIIKVSTPCS